MRFEQAINGEWIQPKTEGYKIRCCDCGLVHHMDFRITEENRVQFCAVRDNRATGQVRRHKKQQTLDVVERNTLINWLIERRQKLKEKKERQLQLKPRDIQSAKIAGIKARTLQEVINYLGL